MKMPKKIPGPLVAALVALLVPAGAFAVGVIAVAMQSPAAPTPYLPHVSLDPALLTAKAAIIYDPTTHLVWFQKSANERFFSSTAGTYGSAYDAAQLEAAAAAFATTTDQAAALALSDVPGLVAAKTEYTDTTSAAAVFDVEPGHPLVAVVLGSIPETRSADIKLLINAARTAH